MVLLSAIRRGHFRQRIPIREIEQRTEIIAQHDPQVSAGEYCGAEVQGPARPSKLDPFHEKLSAWLRIEGGKPRRQRRTAKQMHADLVVLGYDGSYNRVAAFVRA